MTPSHPGNPSNLRDAPFLIQPQTQAVFKALAAGGHVSRCVGGAVRNALLGKPVHDIDIATTATPEQVVNCAKTAGLQAIETGLRHGTITILCDHIPYEITTLRRDVATDGRHAVVTFTDDWSEDARRRDFTMNALYCDPDGRVFDPLGGYGDLMAQLVRFIGHPSDRITEDYLRILRFFRFNAQFGAELGSGSGDSCDDEDDCDEIDHSDNTDRLTQIDHPGLSACITHRAGLTRLSSERIRVELLKLLQGPNAFAICQIMYDTGFLPGLLGVAPQITHLRQLVMAERLLDLPADPVLRLAALGVIIFDDVPRLAARLRLSKRDTAILQLASHTIGPNAIHLQPGDGAAADLLMSAKRTLYELGASAYQRRVILDLANALANPSRPNPGQAIPKCDLIAQPATSNSHTEHGDGLSCINSHRCAWRHLYDLPERASLPAMPVSGGDLITLGIAPGPHMGAYLRDFETWWIAAGFPDNHARNLAQLQRIVDASRKNDN